MPENTDTEATVEDTLALTPITITLHSVPSADGEVAITATGDITLDDGTNGLDVHEVVSRNAKRDLLSLMVNIATIITADKLATEFAAKLGIDPSQPLDEEGVEKMLAAILGLGVEETA